MYKRPSLTENFVYQTLYLALRILMPVVTIPYIARVIGPEGIGIHSYTVAYTAYFTAFAVLGSILYGSRSIAYVRDNPEEKNRVFWEIFFFNCITTAVSALAYLVFVYFLGGDYTFYFLLQGILILACFLDTTWFFVGIEDIKKIAIRDISFNVIYVIALFIFVNDKNDITFYILLTSSKVFLQNIIMIFYLKDHIKFKRVTLSGIINHYKPNFKIFSGRLVEQIRPSLNSIIIGIFLGIKEVGLYDSAYKILLVTGTVTGGLGPILLPRISNLIAKDDEEGVRYYVSKSFLVISYISIFFALMIIGVSKEFVPLFFGEGFEKVVILMNILAPSVLFGAWIGLVNSQVFIPRGKEHYFFIFGIIGIVVNILLNVILIPYFKTEGIAIAFLISQIIIVGFMFYRAKDFFQLNLIFKEPLKYLAAGVIACITAKITGSILGASILTTFTQGVLGMLIYFTLTLLFKCEINSMIIDKFKKILKIQESNA